MYHLSTRGRRTVAVTTFAFVLATTAACGTKSGSDVDTAVPEAPAAVQPHVGSADSWERRLQNKESQWGPERRGYQYEEGSVEQQMKIRRNDPRIPDFSS